MEGIPPDKVTALHASHDRLALAYDPCRVRLIAAVSRRILVDGEAFSKAYSSPALSAINLRLSERGELLAWASSDGSVHVFALASAVISGRTADMVRLLHVPGLGWHDRITAFAWVDFAHLGAAVAPLLASGDVRGEVRLWQLSDAHLAHGLVAGGVQSESRWQRRILLPAEGSPVVQLEYGAATPRDEHGVLLASTHARTSLLPLPPPPPPPPPRPPPTAVDQLSTSSRTSSVDNLRRSGSSGSLGGLGPAVKPDWELLAQLLSSDALEAAKEDAREAGVDENADGLAQVTAANGIEAGGGGGGGGGDAVVAGSGKGGGGTAGCVGGVAVACAGGGAGGGAGEASSSADGVWAPPLHAQ